MRFFYFSNGQKIGIIALLLVIVVLFALGEILLHINKQDYVGNTEFMEEVALFKKSLQEVQTRRTSDRETIVLSQFDPNTLDSIGFRRLGISSFTTTRILNYRSRGGRFRRPNDLARIHGISESQFRELLPYIVIEQSEQAVSQERRERPVSRSIPERREVAPLFVELNSADTTALQQIRGIGPVFARRIVRHRQQLGGFVNKEQLKEIRGFTQERYDEVARFMTIDTTLIRKIPINRAGVVRLRSHYYLNFYASKAIYERRREMGRLSSHYDLMGLKDLPEETLHKILPYLCFE